MSPSIGSRAEASPRPSPSSSGSILARLAIDASTIGDDTTGLFKAGRLEPPKQLSCRHVPAWPAIKGTQDAASQGEVSDSKSCESSQRFVGSPRSQRKTYPNKSELCLDAPLYPIIISYGELTIHEAEVRFGLPPMPKSQGGQNLGRTDLVS